MTERELFLTAILGCSRSDLYSRPPALTPDQERALVDMENRRRAGEPLQYILGTWDFMGLPLQIDPRVLIPRPETEILVETAIRVVHEHLPPGDLTVLDIGTGSGNMAIALAKSLPASRVTTIDISPDALAVARENARRHGVVDQIRFVLADVKEFFRSLAKDGQRFHVIVSNPPYIPTSQLSCLPLDVQQEPQTALDGGADGLYYLRQIIGRSGEFLHPGGTIFLEIGDGQGPAVSPMFSPTIFGAPLFIKDYTGTDRVVWAKKA